MAKTKTKKPVAKKVAEYVDPILYEEGVLTRKGGMKEFLKNARVFIITKNHPKYKGSKEALVEITKPRRTALAGLKKVAVKKTVKKKVAAKKKAAKK